MIKKENWHVKINAVLQTTLATKFAEMINFNKRRNNVRNSFGNIGGNFSRTVKNLTLLSEGRKNSERRREN